MISLREMCQLILTISYLRKLCLQKKIVFIRAGNKYLLNAERLREYLENGEAVNNGNS